MGLGPGTNHQYDLPEGLSPSCCCSGLCASAWENQAGVGGWGRGCPMGSLPSMGTVPGTASPTPPLAPHLAGPVRVHGGLWQPEAQPDGAQFGGDVDDSGPAAAQTLLPLAACSRSSRNSCCKETGAALRCGKPAVCVLLECKASSWWCAGHAGAHPSAWRLDPLGLLPSTGAVFQLTIRERALACRRQEQGRECLLMAMGGMSWLRGPGKGDEISLFPVLCGSEEESPSCEGMKPT